MPPFPHPTTVQPLIQIRQSLTLPGLSQTAHNQTAALAGSQTNNQLENVCVAATFGRSRGWLAGTSAAQWDKDANKRAVDSLFLMSWTGMLVEHLLEPHAKCAGDNSKVTDDTPLDCNEIPRAQWLLSRSVSRCTVVGCKCTNHADFAKYANRLSY